MPFSICHYQWVKVNLGIFIFLLHIPFVLKAQTHSTDSTENPLIQKTFHFKNHSTDTTQFPYLLKKGNYYILNGSLFFAVNDTLVNVADTNSLLFSRYHVKLDTVFNTKLEETSRKTQVTQSLYQKLLPAKAPPAGKSQRGEKDFEKFEGKIIASINFKELPVFGSEIYDTVIAPLHDSKAFFNKAHVYTKAGKIKKLLLFEAGEPVKPFQMADCERIIRSLDAIADARIQVVTDAVDTTQVHLLVITRDAFPFSVGGQMYAIDRGRLDVRHSNLLGLGHQQINRFYTDASGTEKGYHGIYQMENLYKTFINARFEYYRVGNQQYSGFRMYRDFITPEIKYAGSFRIYGTQKTMVWSSFPADSTVEVNYHEEDVWVGRNFQLLSVASRKGFGPSLNFSGRVYAIQYQKKPEALLTDEMLNTTQVLAKVGYWQQKFYKNNMVYSSGFVEDIPTGFLAEMVGGMQFSSSKYKPYTAFHGAWGHISRNNTYVYLKLELGSFFNNKKPDQGIFSFNAKCFTPLIKTSGPFFRQFASLHFVHGYDQSATNLLTLNSGFGLRGYSEEIPSGNSRLVFSTETVIFPRFYLLGYGSTFFTFYDVGAIGNNLTQLVNQKVYSGLGIGFRFRNNQSLIKSVEIRLTWFPVVPQGAHWNYYMSSEQTLQIENLSPGIPETISVK